MKSKIEIDTKDIEILNLLQSDATRSVQAIGAEIGLTNNPCWRRIKRLQESGLIKRYTIDIDRQLIGLGTTAFVTLKIENHNSDWLEKFSRSVVNIPEIIECHRMTGNVDYLLKIAVLDLNHYDRVYRRLIKEVSGLIDVSSTFSMEAIKAQAPIDVTTAKNN